RNYPARPSPPDSESTAARRARGTRREPWAPTDPRPLRQVERRRAGMLSRVVPGTWSDFLVSSFLHLALGIARGVVNRLAAVFDVRACASYGVATAHQGSRRSDCSEH